MKLANLEERKMLSAWLYVRHRRRSKTYIQRRLHDSCCCRSLASLELVDGRRSMPCGIGVRLLDSWSSFDDGVSGSYGVDGPASVPLNRRIANTTDTSPVTVVRADASHLLQGLVPKSKQSKSGSVMADVSCHERRIFMLHLTQRTRSQSSR